MKDPNDVPERYRLRDPIEQLLWKEAQFEILWERVERRNANPGEFQLTKKELENGFKFFQPPTENEGKSYDYFHHYLNT